MDGRNRHSAIKWRSTNQVLKKEKKKKEKERDAALHNAFSKKNFPIFFPHAS